MADAKQQAMGSKHLLCQFPVRGARAHQQIYNGQRASNMSPGLRATISSVTFHPYFLVEKTVDSYWSSDILFPYRSPYPRPHPDPTQHPETDPETDPKRSRNGAEMNRDRAFHGGTGGGFVRGRWGGGVVREKRKSLYWRSCRNYVGSKGVACADSVSLIGVIFILSSCPEMLVARVANDGTNSKEDPSIASPTG